ncbi:hypothetical protein FACS1894176_07860 [Bacteroidia bacterium]|nr:hypothetical protein FACS1894176_07860 [Bacteroidia bacterium]
MGLTTWSDAPEGKIQKSDVIIAYNPGRVTHEIAKSFAVSEFEKYRIVQDQLFTSDFDRLLEETKTKRK